MTFEDNLKELSEIVSKLEKGDLALEEAVELYGKGVKISVVCREELDNAKLKIAEQGEG